MEELASVTCLTLLQMQEHVSILINAFDPAHRILFWNRKCELYFGIDAQTAIGKKLEDVLPFTKGYECTGLLNRALMGQEVHILNGRYQNATGSYEQRIIPVRDKTGKVMAALNMVTDLS